VIGELSAPKLSVEKFLFKAYVYIEAA
jgi:hypothetical protein